MSSKAWVFLAVLFGAYAAIACYFYTKNSVESLPKRCNQCGYVTKNRYNVCKNCLQKDNFTLVNEENISIDSSKRHPAFITMIAAAAVLIISFVVEVNI